MQNSKPGKLNTSKEGASIVIALITFLIAAVLSAVIAGAAAASAGKVAKYRETEEAYLMTASCIITLNDEVSRTNMKLEAATDSKTGVTSYNFTSTAQTDSFLSMFRDGIKDIYINGGSTNGHYQNDFEITVPVSSAGDTYTVSGTFYMYKSYDVEVHFTNVKGTDTKIHTNTSAYSLYVTFKATAIDKKDDGDPKYIKVFYDTGEIGNDAEIN